MRRRRRSRSAVIVALAVVLLAQVGMNLALETARPDLRDPEYGCRLDRVRKLGSEYPERPLVIALGSSRTQTGLSPNSMPPLATSDGTPVTVFNFGLAGAGPLQELLVLNRLLEADVRPDYLLVEVLSPALHQDGDGSEFVELSRLGLSDLAVLKPYCQRPDELVIDWCELRASPWTAVRFVLMSRVLPGWLPWGARVDYMWETVDRFGWLPYPRQDVTAEQRAEGLEHAREQYKNFLSNFHISPIPDRAVREIIAACRREGIPLAFYLMPESTTFRGWYPETTRTEIRRYLQSISEEHGVPVIDASDWLPDSDFTDGHHLLPRGADRFSSRFAREVLAPWLSGANPTRLPPALLE